MTAAHTDEDMFADGPASLRGIHTWADEFATLKSHGAAIPPADQPVWIEAMRSYGYRRVLRTVDTIARTGQTCWFSDVRKALVRSEERDAATMASPRTGMPLRDQFALAAMREVMAAEESLADLEGCEYLGLWIARRAYELADAMLRVRGEPRS